MEATETSCSTAIPAAKKRLQILHLQHRDFNKRFARTFYEQMVALIQIRNLEIQ